MEGDFEKVRTARTRPTKADIKGLVDILQEAYASRDVILSSLDTDQMMGTVDNICRAFSVSLDRNDTKYVFSKLLVASKGLALADRKRIFVQHKLLIQEEFQWRDYGFAKMVFSCVGDQPHLLISHVFGAGFLNSIEAVLSFVQTTYLQGLGFAVGVDSIDIWIRDSGNHHYKVEMDKAFEEPRWVEMEEGEFAELESHLYDRPKDDVLFFSGGAEYTAYKHVRKILGAARRFLLIVDPYVDDATVKMLEAVPAEVDIRVLCTKLQGDAVVLAAKFTRERGKVDFRVSTALHDRYLFTDGHGYILGASLNRFGSKASTIVRIGDGEVVHKIQRHFDGLWSQSKSLER